MSEQPHACWRCKLRERLYDGADFLWWLVAHPAGNVALAVAVAVLAVGVGLMCGASDTAHLSHSGNLTGGEW